MTRRDELVRVTDVLVGFLLGEVSVRRLDRAMVRARLSGFESTQVRLAAVGLVEARRAREQADR